MPKWFSLSWCWCSDNLLVDGNTEATIMEIYETIALTLVEWILISIFNYRFEETIRIVRCSNVITNLGIWGGYDDGVYLGIGIGNGIMDPPLCWLYLVYIWYRSRSWIENLAIVSVVLRGPVGSSNIAMEHDPIALWSTFPWVVDINVSVGTW
jgi:hypothetical protein